MIKLFTFEGAFKTDLIHFEMSGNFINEFKTKGSFLNYNIILI